MPREVIEPMDVFEFFNYLGYIMNHSDYTRVGIRGIGTQELSHLLFTEIGRNLCSVSFECSADMLTQLVVLFLSKAQGKLNSKHPADRNVA